MANDAKNFIICVPTARTLAVVVLYRFDSKTAGFTNNTLLFQKESRVIPSTEFMSLLKYRKIFCEGKPTDKCKSYSNSLFFLSI